MVSPENIFERDSVPDIESLLNDGNGEAALLHVISQIIVKYRHLNFNIILLDIGRLMKRSLMATNRMP